MNEKLDELTSFLPSFPSFVGLSPPPPPPPPQLVNVFEQVSLLSLPSQSTVYRFLTFNFPLSKMADNEPSLAVCARVSKQWSLLALQSVPSPSKRVAVVVEELIVVLAILTQDSLGITTDLGVSASFDLSR